jgi:hypothetical protein
MWWHLASGAWMLDQGRVLDRDVYSHTRAGTPYDSAQWLGQVALALAHRAAGWLGVDLLRGALVGVFAWSVTRATLRLQPHLGWAAPVIALTLLVSSTRWSDRPQLFTLALVPLVLDLLLAARLEGRTRRLVLLPPLFLAWANLHGGSLVGLVLVGVFVTEALVSRASALRGIAAAFVASVIAVQVTPSTLGGIAYAVGYTTTSWPFIVEELPTDIRTPVGLVLAAFVLGTLGAALVLGRDAVRERVGPPLLWAGLLVPFAFLGFAAQRHVPIACAVYAPFVAVAVPAALGRPRAVAPLLPRAVSLSLGAAVVAGAALVAAVAAPRSPDLSAYPTGALAPLANARGAILNEYDWGGWLIHAAPQHPTFIDGRGALLFVPDVLSDFDRAVGLRPGYEDVLRRWDIALVLLRPDRPLVGALRKEGWRALGEEADRWVLLARP